MDKRLSVSTLLSFVIQKEGSREVIREQTAYGGLVKKVSGAPARHLGFENHFLMNVPEVSEQQLSKHDRQDTAVPSSVRRGASKGERERAERPFSRHIGLYPEKRWARDR